MQVFEQADCLVGVYTLHGASAVATAMFAEAAPAVASAGVGRPAEDEEAGGPQRQRRPAQLPPVLVH